MESLREYALSVIAAAMICAVLLSLVQSKHSGDIIRFVTGLFLTITILRPIHKIDFYAFAEEIVPQEWKTMDIVEQGKVYANNAMADIIIKESEAYILDKAANLGADIEVAVSLDESNIPKSARICGELSPSLRRNIEQLLESDLGITKENQLWTGNQQSLKSGSQ